MSAELKKAIKLAAQDALLAVGWTNPDDQKKGAAAIEVRLGPLFELIEGPMQSWGTAFRTAWDAALKKATEEAGR